MEQRQSYTNNAEVAQQIHFQKKKRKSNQIENYFLCTTTTEPYSVT